MTMNTCTPSVLNMILLIMAIITGIQVLIIVYSGRVHLDLHHKGNKYSSPLSFLIISQESIPSSNSSSTANISYYYYYVSTVNNETSTTGTVEDTEKENEETSSSVSSSSSSSNTAFPSITKDDTIPYKLVWLMSFPNSGTSYTMQAVQKYTRICTATNYAEESEDPTPIPLYNRSTNNNDQQKQQGPYWVHRTSDMSFLPSPFSYILTKTHCDGYCNANKRCKVSKMYTTIMSLSNFQRGCLGIPIHHQPTTINSINNSSTSPSSYSYSPSIVFKAIHLVRDPLDNIVSRFHLAYKKLSPSDQKIYTRDDVGFQRFCKYWDTWQVSNTTNALSNNNMNNKRKRKELFGDKNTTRYLEIQIPWKSKRDILTLSDVDHVPCWADFFRYVNWHNNAFHVQKNMNLSSLLLYYDDYEEEGKWNQSMDQILHFLNQTKGTVKGKRGRVHPFKAGKGYHHYFTLDQRQAVWTFIEKISIPETWHILQRY